MYNSRRYMTSDTLISAGISLVTSLATSWYVADRYFTRQREIEQARESQEVQLAFKKLVHAYFPMLKKRPKLRAEVRDAMNELEAKVKIYRPD
jgi:hypothetical protein